MKNNKNMKKQLEIDYIYSKTSILMAMIIFLFTFFSISSKSFSEEKPVTTIESLPVREKAEMNIEVTKLIAEKMVGKINLEEKIISLDFTEMNERVAKSRMRINEEDYEIFFIENLDSLPTYSNNGVGSNSKNKKGMKYNYKVVENNGKKKIKIDYTEKPETLYMVVIDKKSGNLIKVFNISNFEEEEVETYATVNGTITTGTTSQNFMKYTYDNANCVLQDFGGTSVSTLKSCTNVRVYQDGTTANASFPAMAVGGSWTNTNNILADHISLPTYSFTNGTNSVPTTIFLTPVSYSYTSGRYRRFLANSSPERGKVYGSYGNQVAESVTAKLNMEISADNLKTVRKIVGGNVTLTNSASNGSNQLTFIHARLETVNFSNNYYVPRRVSSISTSATNISTYSASAKYPNITVEKVIMENNIVLNFKSGYAENATINFNETGTTGYTANQLEVVKTGNQPNYFMTGLASEGIVEFRRDGFTTGDVLGTKSASTTGVVTATSLALTGKNGFTANLSLSYRAGGLATVRVVNWTGEDEYDLYIVHEEASRLIRRKHKVTIKTPAIYKTESGNVGTHPTTAQMTYIQSFKELEIRDYVGAGYDRNNDVGTMKAQQTNSYEAGAFPVIAVGSGWRSNNTSITSTSGIADITSNFNTSLIPINMRIYLKNGKTNVVPGQTIGTYKRTVASSNPERARIYGSYSASYSYETIDADLVMEFPENILTQIRKINNNNFNLSSGDADQITYATGRYTLSGSTHTFNIPYNNNTSPTSIIYRTTKNYPSIRVDKEIVANNVALEFHKEYRKGEWISFSYDGETTEPHITKTVTEGENSNNFNSDYFMTGTPFNGTIEISGNLESSIAPISVDSEGKTGVIALSLRNEKNQRAIFNLQYSKDGAVKMSLDSWTGQGEFPIEIRHKEESTLVRRTYKVTIKTPTAFEFISATELDFGTIVKGFTGDTATATIIVKGLGSDGLILIPEDENIDLVNGASKITAGEFNILESSKRNGEETYILTGVIVDSSEATVSGVHTGTLQLKVDLVPTTKTSTPK